MCVVSEDVTWAVVDIGRIRFLLRIILRLLMEAAGSVNVLMRMFRWHVSRVAGALGRKSRLLIPTLLKCGEQRRGLHMPGSSIDPVGGSTMLWVGVEVGVLSDM